MKVGLYSITYLGIWYDGPALTFSEFVKRAKTYGYPLGLDYVDEQARLAQEFMSILIQENT